MDELDGRSLYKETRGTKERSRLMWDRGPGSAQVELMGPALAVDFG